MGGKGMNKESKHGVAMNKPLRGKKINPLYSWAIFLYFSSNISGIAALKS